VPTACPCRNKTSTEIGKVEVERETKRQSIVKRIAGKEYPRQAIVKD